MVELTIENLGIIISVIVAIVTVAVYIAKLNWKINMLEDRIKNHPLLSAFDTHIKGTGVETFFHSVLKDGRVESKP